MVLNERLDQEQSTARKKAIEADQKQKELEKVSANLTGHLQTFRCKEAEWQASEDDMQGQVKKANEENERLISQVDRLRNENEKLRSHRATKSQYSARNYMSNGGISP